MPTKTAPVAQRLASQARGLVAAITSGLDNRKHHPTYGYTKAVLRADLHRLEGMLYAQALVATGKQGASVRLQAIEAAEALGIDLVALEKAIDAS